MTTPPNVAQQVKLEQHQIEAFYIDCFANDQVAHFQRLTENIPSEKKKVVVDIGGGCGYFAKDLNTATGLRVRVIDSDKKSIKACRDHHIDGIEAVLGDALRPRVAGDEDIVCFNLILHHLIGRNEKETREIQSNALTAWREQSQYIFVNEYIYDSLIRNLSGRLIFEITKSKLLSSIGAAVSKVIPSFKANTFGVGVRFRAHKEWMRLFEECGYEVVSKAHGEVEHTALPLRLLLIAEVRRDSFLLKRKGS